MYDYIKLLEKLYARRSTENNRKDRTGTGTVAIFGHMLEHDIRHTKKFPLFPLREMNFKNIVVELLWFLRGESNIDFLRKHGCEWWTYQCSDNGDVGPLYGKQWRGFTDEYGNKTPDQLRNVIKQLREDPYSRRIIINSWDVDKIPDNNCDYDENVKSGKMALAPCHHQVQFFVEDDGKHKYLSLLFNMRSSDVFLGLPANIASYALLLHIVARLVNMKPHRVVYSGGDVHLYSNHFEATNTLLTRLKELRDEADYSKFSFAFANSASVDIKHDVIMTDNLPKYTLPKEFDDLVNVDDLDFTDERLIDVLVSGLSGYKPLPAIKVKMAK